MRGFGQTVVPMQGRRYGAENPMFSCCVAKVTSAKTPLSIIVPLPRIRALTLERTHQTTNKSQQDNKWLLRYSQRGSSCCAMLSDYRMTTTTTWQLSKSAEFHNVLKSKLEIVKGQFRTTWRGMRRKDVNGRGHGRFKTIDCETCLRDMGNYRLDIGLLWWTSKAS
jgi:hypothetical protein